ncbi:MAG: class B sortase [Lachnospiraceae bacterium]|nr:class B sortase [Lachnospiraceae bacterium]
MADINNMETKAAINGHGKSGLAQYEPEMQEQIIAFIKKKEKQRKIFIIICAIIALASFTTLGIYSYFGERTQKETNALAQLVGDTRFLSLGDSQQVMVHRTADAELPDILEKYQTLYNRNKRLIGWLKIDGTNIDFPVMQTVNNEYYLDRNFSQEYDKNGSIFMDFQCLVFPRSDNLIIYGHNMKSGQMFGQLSKYEKKSHFEKHPIIKFDTIYEEGTYEIMFVFRSKVYNEDEIVFKYYQFIDAWSADEFYSNMREMAALSYYDTGVTATYGDQLLTLSTCDQSQNDMRFVVVARRVY